MKKYLKIALAFAVYGLLSGVFYREFTKYKAFEGRTMLGMAHPHILMLGLGGFILLALFVKVLGLEGDKRLIFPDGCFITGIIVASAMMLFRGTVEVAGLEPGRALSGAIAGIAGLGHVAVAVGLIRYLTVFIKKAS